MTVDLKSDLKVIAQRLYDRHAAVMIGAGFSRNASKDYPCWEGLGNLFYSVLHPDAACPEGHYWNIMDLADEVAASKGRAFLDDLVQRCIKDGTIQPSPIHERLLELPWADVFTTNYDTLLEATLPRLIGRRYSVVVNPDQLSVAKGARIVKLHGSFPAYKPYILTTEDYRRYPETHAPFVNTVRQSFLENTLCLIGFSGDDPNFLNWAGWIRDNLGALSQPIYLITMERPSASRMALLSARNVKVLPLCDFNDVKNTDFIHGYQKFFEYLWDGRPVGERWGMPSERVDPNGDILKQMEERLDRWRAERKAYDGKLLLSRMDKTVVIQDLRLAVPLFAKLPLSVIGLSFCVEFVWRMDRAGVAMTQPVMAEVEKFVTVWMESGDIEKCFSSRELKAHNLDFDEIFGLAVRLLRTYRELALQSKWNRLFSFLEGQQRYASREHINELWYQCVLHKLSLFDVSAAFKTLDSWNPDSSDPIALARCGMLYAATRNWRPARDALSRALVAVRRVSSFNDDIRFLQTESAVIWVWNWVMLHDPHPDSDERMRKTMWMRLDELRGLGCDIRQDLVHFEWMLKSDRNEGTTVEKVDSFDLRSCSETMKWRMSVEDGYSFFSFAECAGLPMCMINDADSVKRALLDVVHSFPSIVFTYLCIYGNNSIVKDVITRESLVGIDREYAASVAMSVVKGLMDCLLRPSSYDVLLAQFDGMVQLASRLFVCSMGPDLQDLVVKFLKLAYAHPERLPMGVDLGTFVDRFVASIPDSGMASLAAEFVNINPPVVLAGPNVTLSLSNPLYRIFGVLESEERGIAAAKSFAPVKLAKPGWRRIVHALKSPSEAHRAWAFASALLYLVARVLEADQVKEFAALVFENEGGSDFNPYLGDFYESVALKLVKPSKAGFKNWYVDRILSGKWFDSNCSVAGHAISQGRSRQIDNALAAIHHAVAFFDEITTGKMLERISSEWNTCRELIACQDVVPQMGIEYTPSLRNEGFDRALSLSHFMSELVPLIRKEWGAANILKDVLKDFARENAPCLELELVSSGDVLESEAQKFALLIATSLHARVRAHAVDAARALRRMLRIANDKIREQAESVALNALCWVSPSESELAELIVGSICELPRIPDVFQRVQFDLIARWSQKIDMAIDTGISGEVKTRAIIAIGRMLKRLVSVAELNPYRQDAVAHMKKTMADPLPFVEVDRAWSWLDVDSVQKERDVVSQGEEDKEEKK